MTEAEAYAVENITENTLERLKNETPNVALEVVARLFAEVIADVALSRREVATPLLIARSRAYARAQLQTALSLRRIDQAIDVPSLSRLLDQLQKPQ